MSQNKTPSPNPLLLAAVVGGGAALATGVLLWDLRNARNRRLPPQSSNTSQYLQPSPRGQYDRIEGSSSHNGGGVRERLARRHTPADPNLAHHCGRTNMNPVETWNVPDVQQWATAQALPAEIVQVLTREHIDGSTLLELDDEQCTSIGIKALGLRRRLLREIETLRHFPPNGRTPPMESQRPTNVRTRPVEARQEVSARTPPPQMTGTTGPHPVGHIPTPSRTVAREHGAGVAAELSPRGQVLYQQLEKVQQAMKNEFSGFPKERQAVVVSACLQVLQKVMAASETLAEGERVVILRTVKSIFQELEEFDLSQIEGHDEREEGEEDEDEDEYGSKNPQLRSQHRIPPCDRSGSTHGVPGARNPLAPRTSTSRPSPPSGPLSASTVTDQTLSVLESIQQGLLNPNVIRSSQDLLPFSDALERILKGPVEMLQNPEVATQLRACMELLLKCSKEWTDRKKEVQQRPTAAVPSSLNATATAEQRNSVQALSQQLLQIYTVLQSPAFQAAPQEKQRAHRESMYPLMARVEKIISTLQPAFRVELQPQLDDVYTLLEGARATDHGCDESNSMQTSIEKEHEESNRQLLLSLTELLQTIKTRSFHELLELKPYAEAVQRLMQSESVARNQEMCSLIQNCMMSLVERSQQLQEAAAASARSPTPTTGSTSAPVSGQPAPPTDQAVQLLLEQLDRSIAIFSSPSFPSLDMEKQITLRHTSLELLEALAVQLDELPVPQRTEVLKRASQLSGLLRREQDRDATTASEESSQPPSLGIRKKIDAMQQLTEIMQHSEFRSIPTRQQFELMQQLMLVLQSLTPDEAVQHRSVVEAAMQTAESVQVLIQQSSHSISHSSHIIDLLPRITERLLMDNFAAKTSPFELFCIREILQLGRSLAADLNADTRATLMDILTPIEETLEHKIENLTEDEIQEQFGSLHRLGHPQNRVVYGQDSDTMLPHKTFYVVIGQGSPRTLSHATDADVHDSSSEDEKDVDVCELEEYFSYSPDHADVQITSDDIAIVHAGDPEAHTALHLLIPTLQECRFQILRTEDVRCQDTSLSGGDEEQGPSSPLKSALAEATSRIEANRRVNGRLGASSPSARLLVCELDAGCGVRTAHEVVALLDGVPSGVHVVYLQQSDHHIHVVQCRAKGGMDGSSSSRSHPKSQRGTKFVAVSDWRIRMDEEAAKATSPAFPFSSTLRTVFLEALIHDPKRTKGDGDTWTLSLARVLMWVIQQLAPKHAASGCSGVLEIDEFADLGVPLIRPLIIKKASIPE